MSQPSNTLLRKNLLGLIIFFAFLLCVGVRESLVPMVLAQSQDWESSIRKFEEGDKVNPPKPGGIVITGASSIRRWDTLVAEMKPLDVMNRLPTGHGRSWCMRATMTWRRDRPSRRK